MAGIVLAAIYSAPSIAADAPVGKSMPAAFSWTGVYAGVHGGYVRNKLQAHEVHILGTTFPLGADDAKAEPNGRRFGGQIGADYEFANHIVVGIAADISNGRLEGESRLTAVNLIGVPFESKGGNAWTVRGRLGYALDYFMIYGTGGFASSKATLSVPILGFTPVSKTHSGWVAGVGAEFQLIGNWRLGAEYRYLSLGTEDYCFFSLCFPMKWRAHQALATLNYQF